jgi:hypothetical protein
MSLHPAAPIPPPVPTYTPAPTDSPSQSSAGSNLRFQLSTWLRPWTWLLGWAIASLVCALRNPSALWHPVLYAEDGTAYVTQVYSLGVWRAAFNAKDEYLVFGKVLFAGVAIQINQVLFGNDVTQLPVIIAVLSFLFFGFVLSLPLLLFAQQFSKGQLGCLLLMGLLLPLNNTEYEVTGRILNIGFLMSYAAFVLIAYRTSPQARSIGRWILLVDVGIYLCASTNPVVNLFLPLIWLPDAVAGWQRWQRRRSRHPLKGRAAPPTQLAEMPAEFSPPIARLSAAGLTLLLVGQGVYSLLRFTMLDPTTAATVKSASLAATTWIETLFGRSMLYPLIFPIYHWMTDGWVMLLLTLVVTIALKVATPQHRRLYLVATYCLVTTSLATLLLRPLLLHVANGYSTTFPDRYYYGQNLMALFLLVLICADLCQQRHRGASRCGKGLLWAYAALFLVTGTTSIGQQWSTAPLADCHPLPEAVAKAAIRDQVAFRPAPTNSFKEDLLTVQGCPNTEAWPIFLPRSRVQQVGAED